MIGLPGIIAFEPVEILRIIGQLEVDFECIENKNIWLTSHFSGKNAVRGLGKFRHA